MLKFLLQTSEDRVVKRSFINSKIKEAEIIFSQYKISAPPFASFSIELWGKKKARNCTNPKIWAWGGISPIFAVAAIKQKDCFFSHYGMVSLVIHPQLFMRRNSY